MHKKIQERIGNLRLIPPLATLLFLLAFHPVLLAQFNTISIINDPGMDVGRYSSIAVGSDGRPVISYWDSTQNQLWLLKCSDATCTAANPTRMGVYHVGVNGSGHTSLALDANDAPIISFFDANEIALRVIKCDDPVCGGDGEIYSIVDSAGFGGEYSSIAIDSLGLPVIAYKDLANDALKVAKCNDTACAGDNETVTTVDNSGGVAGYISLAIGADGLPVISYYDWIATALKVAKCNDAACAGNNESVTIVDNDGDVGAFSSLAIGDDGMPVISYHQYSFTPGERALKVAKCTHNSCANGNVTISTIDGPADLGSHTSITIGGDSNPVISYYDGVTYSLKVAWCNDPDCTGNNETLSLVDGPDGRVGWESSITLGLDNLPVISYYDLASGALRVAKCNDAACSGGDELVTKVDDGPNDVGDHSSLAIGADGLPLIVYHDKYMGALKAAKCNDPRCEGGDERISIVDNPANDVGWYASVAIASNGYPIISYHDDTAGTLKVAKCNDTACAGMDETISVVDDTALVGWDTSIALEQRGLPVISYYDVTNQSLKVAFCNDTACRGGNETLSPVDDPLNGDVGWHSSIAIGSDNLPVISYFDYFAGALKVAKCNDPACAGANETLSLVDDLDDVGRFTSLVLDSNELPVISYYDSVTESLKLAKCDDSACTSGNVTINTVDTPPNGAGWYTAMALDGNNRPVISHGEWTTDSIRVSKCNDAACAGGNESVTVLDEPGGAGGWAVRLDTSLVLGWDALPLISYYDARRRVLKVAHCGTLDCVNNVWIAVRKDFSDNNPSQVHVTLDCNGGTPISTELDISEGNSGTFLVRGIEPGVTDCEVTETAKVGYNTSYFNQTSQSASSCKFEDIESANLICDITNALDSIQVPVTKGWVGNFSGAGIPTMASANWTCRNVRSSPSGGTTTLNGVLNFSGQPDTEVINGLYPDWAGGSWCDVIEQVSIDGVSSNDDDCANLPIAPGSGNDCTITNTLNTDIFTVNKDFVPNHAGTVSMTASCSSGTVTNNPQDASEGFAAVFTVSGASPEATCTASEDTVPTGYSKNEADCQDDDPINGSCTIQNNLISDNFTVAKQYSNDNTTPVTISLNCTSGNIASNMLTAAPGSPAVFEITAASPVTTCTAIESDAPAGYARNESDCQDGDSLGGSCTIINTLMANPPARPVIPDACVVYSSRETVKVSWQHDSINTSGYTVEGRNLGPSELEAVRLCQVPGEPPDESGNVGGWEEMTTSATLNQDWYAYAPSLDCEAHYEFRVAANNNGTLSQYSNIVSAITGIADRCVDESNSGLTSESQFGSEGSGSGEFSSPAGAEVDDAGNLVIADTENSRVQICDTNGNCSDLGATSDGPDGAPVQFFAPEDVAIDSLGRIIVADTGNDRIQICDAGICTPMGGPGAEAGQFNLPRGVAVDGLDRILVADSGNHRVQRCDDSGSCIVIGGPGSAVGQFDTPFGIAAGHDLGIWVADTRNHRIQRCNGDGICTAFGDFGTEPGEFDMPTRVGVDRDDRIVIADSGNQRVQMCNTQGDCVVLDRPYTSPQGIAIDNNGQIVVVDGGGHSIETMCLVYPYSEFGDEGILPGEFRNPMDVAMGSHGRIVVADRDNHRIQICNKTGECSAFGTSGTAIGDFRFPSAVTVDVNDRIVVADRDNHRFQICDYSGNCTGRGGLGAEWGEFNQPGGVTTMMGGFEVITFVADTGNGRVQFCDSAGCLPLGFPGEVSFVSPQRVAMVSDERYVFVSDLEGGGRIRRCDFIDDTCSTMYGAGSTSGQFVEPRGMALDASGRLLIADSGNSRVQLCNDGSCSIIGSPGHGPGQFNSPSGVDFDDEGRIIVADSGNHRIQILQRCGPTNRVFGGGFEE